MASYSPQSFALQGPPYHVTQCAGDIETTKRAFGRLFSRPATEGNVALGRRALFCRISDLLVEVMVPGASATTLNEFVDRFGHHFHSCAFYVEGIDGLAEHLRGQGIRIIDTDGHRITDKVPIPRFGGTGPVMFTHPADTFGMLEFKERQEDDGQPEHAPEDAVTSQDDPLGIRKFAYLSIVVTDRSAATSLWQDAFGASLLSSGTNSVLGTQSNFIRIGADPGTVIELGEPLESGVVAQEFARTQTSILFSANFVVGDLEATLEHVNSVGLGIDAHDDSLALTESSPDLGARFGFAQAGALSDVLEL